MPKSFTEDGAFGAGDSGGGYNGNFNGGPGSQVGSFTADDSGMALGGGTILGGAGDMQPFGSDLAPGQSSRQGNNIYTNASNSGARGAFGEILTPGNFNPSQAPQNGNFMFAAGGEVEEPGMGFDPMAGQRSDLMDRLAAARTSVTTALGYGRKQNGLEQLDQLSFNPSQSETGVPRERPAPGPLPPTSNPFGKRRQMGAIDEGEEGGEANAAQPMQMAGRMPTIPGNQSESGRPPVQPMPGPLPPTSNPFGRRASAGEDPSGEDAAPQKVAGAIPEEDTEEAA